MNPSKLLAKIREPWLKQVTQTLAQGTNLRESIQGQFERFFELLEEALQTGNPAWLDSILLDWINAPTLTQLHEGAQGVSKIINQVISITSATARDTLSDTETLDLLTAILPFYTYALERVARLETEARINYMNNEITEMKDKLEHLDRTKSNFISVAAHELKTPLTLIEGYSSMLRDTVDSTKSSGADQFLRGMNTGIARMRAIVDDMIDVSLIDNKLLSLNFQPTAISHLLTFLKSELTEIIKLRQQRLIIQKFSGDDAWIYADSERLYQALKNILTNAIKYTPDKGTITLDGRTLPGFVEIIVTDTGIGISHENQTLIFEKFAQLGKVNLHSSGKTKFKGGGPGLGLPITRGIIEAHGGTIWVESEGYDEDKCPGSSFHILLPLRTDASDATVEKLFGKIENLSYGKKDTANNESPA